MTPRSPLKQIEEGMEKTLMQGKIEGKRRRVKPSNHLTIDGVIYKAPSSAHRDRFS